MCIQLDSICQIQERIVAAVEGGLSTWLCRYRQADKSCQVALADSTAPQAVQAGLGSAAAADFLPSQYTHLVTVRSHCVSVCVSECGLCSNRGCVTWL